MADNYGRNAKGADIHSPLDWTLDTRIQRALLGIPAGGRFGSGSAGPGPTLTDRSV